MSREGNYYSLVIEPNYELILNKAVHILDPNKELLDEDGDSLFYGFINVEDVKFLEFTKKYPETLFKLYEETLEETKEHALHYYKNGVHKEVVGKIVYPNFEE